MKTVSAKSPVALSVILILLAIAPSPSNVYARQTQQQSAVQTALQTARQQLGSGDAAAAIATLNEAIEASPEQAVLYSTLGQAHQANNAPREALTAYRKALELTTGTPGEPRARFALGVALISNGETRAATRELSTAVASGAIDITNLLATSVAQTVLDTPELKALLPSADDYAHPFVEDVAILKEWVGEGPRDVYGWIARNIGDVDGDGVDDFTTSSNAVVETGSRSGKVYTYSTATGELLWTATGKVAGGRLGMGIEAAGDVDADGIPDVVAGAPYAGEVFVYNGKTGGVIHHWTAADNTGGFGASVRGIGDLDGDGHGDILVGEPYQIFGFPVNNGDMTRPGNAYVYSGADGSILLKLAGAAAGEAFGSNVHGGTYDGEVFFVIGAPAAAGGGRAYGYRGYTGVPAYTLVPDAGAAQFGAMFMSYFGDATGDGVPDLYIADWGHNKDGVGSADGKFYVFSGADGSKHFDMVGEAPGDGLGIGESVAGDVNGDGAADLVVAAWQHSSAAASGGKVYVVSGSDGSVLWTITGRVPGETLGFDTTRIGDVDGDGHGDFLLTSAYSAVNGWHSGRVIVVSGAPPDGK